MSAAGHTAPDTAAPIVALRSVTKVFANATVALDAVDFEVRVGEFVSLLGPSGCGKSTALRLLAGLIEPTGGTVVWERAADERDRRRAQTLGFVFQEPTLMPWADVFDNVYLPLRLQGLSKAAAAPRVHGALEGVGLAEATRAYPRELSGGMRMRVSIARALVTEPTLLLMDEPFAALDEMTRFRLNDDLLRLYRTLRKTVVFVTHSVFESVYLSSRIVIMTSSPGRIASQLYIEAPYPRDERFRTSAEYAGYCRRTSEALASAMGAERA
jgi:NitT/TauT family transport system ATP-binding protein